MEIINGISYLVLIAEVDPIQKFIPNFSCADFIAIVVAIIAAVCTLWSTHKINLTSEKIDKSNQQFQNKLNDTNNAFQDKWNRKTIEANLIANARIEWIQNVRNTTVSLIIAFYRALSATDEATRGSCLTSVQEKTELLILYFGPEKNKNNNSKEILLCEDTNVNKNQLIVDFLINLSKDLNTYNNNVKYNRLEILEENYSKLLDQCAQNLIRYDHVEYIDDDGEKDVSDEPVFTDEYNNKCTKLAKERDDVRNLPSLIKADLCTLRDIIRIYLKIEWNKAKSITDMSETEK